MTNKIAQLLKDYMQSKGITAYTLTEEEGFNKSTLYNILLMKKQNSPYKIDSLEKLCEELNIDFEIKIIEKNGNIKNG